MATANGKSSILDDINNLLYVTDGGLETTLTFLNNIKLPYFAAFHLLKEGVGKQELVAYFKQYGKLSLTQGCNMWLEAPTWRANSDWGKLLGYSAQELDEANKAAIQLLVDIRDEYQGPNNKFIISGNIGPRHDAYAPDKLMSAEEAEAYHKVQITSFVESRNADVVSALTLSYTDEAIGVAKAAKSFRVPVCISFTVETDGKLPSGISIEDAVTTVDAATEGYPLFYMINCAHPDHFYSTLVTKSVANCTNIATEDTSSDNESMAIIPLWVKRIRGIRANASRLSHAELDNCSTLDAGNPVELAEQFKDLRDSLPHLCVLGGCCGTDLSHISAIATTCGMCELL